MRLFYHIIGRILFLKTAHFDFVFEGDLTIIVHIIQGILLNLPTMIFAYMKEVVGRAKAYLPYGMTLILVFQEFEVSLEGENVRSFDALRHLQ